MFDQNFTNPMGMQGGYQYNGMQQAVPKVQNVLTPEQIKELQQQRSQFSLGLTEKERLQGICTHRSADGMSDTIVYDNATGIASCVICGYQFRPVEPDTSYETIKDATDRIVDILQTIKIMYTDLPAEAAREYFQIIPLIGKIPQLFEFAAKNLSKHEMNNWSYNAHNMGGMAMLQNLSTMFGGMGMNQQPQFNNMGMNPQFNNMNMGMGQQVPFNGYAMNPNQPVGYPNGGMMGQNPFGYAGASQQVPMGQPQMANPAMNNVPPMTQPNPVPNTNGGQVGYVPQSQGFSYNPKASEAPKAPEAPATETVKQTVNV